MFLDISNFIEQISFFSNSIVFLYFFALITEEGFLISSCLLRTVVLEKMFESPLDSKEIKPVNPKGNQP